MFIFCLLGLVFLSLKLNEFVFFGVNTVAETRREICLKAGKIMSMGRELKQPCVRAEGLHRA